MQQLTDEQIEGIFIRCESKMSPSWTAGQALCETLALLKGEFGSEEKMWEVMPQLMVYADKKYLEIDKANSDMASGVSR